LHSHFFGQPISFPCSSRYTVFEASEDQGEPSRKSYLPGFFFSNKRIVCQLHKGLTAWTSSGIQVCREIELSFSSSFQEFLYFQLPLSNTDFAFTSKIGFFCWAVKVGLSGPLFPWIKHLRILPIATRHLLDRPNMTIEYWTLLNIIGHPIIYA